MSLRFRVAFSSACAVLAVLLCIAYADSVHADAERVRAEALERFGGEVASLIVATERLEPGDIINRTNVVVRDWVSDLAPEEAVTELDDVLGREVGSIVAKGAPITELDFQMTGSIADVPSGHVALSLPITDKLGLSRTVTQGTSLVAYAVTSAGTRLVADDMTVLSEAATPASFAVTSSQVTVAVLPSDVAAVLDAAATGDLRLVVPADDVDMNLLRDGYAPVELVPVGEDEAEGDGAL